LEIDEFKQFTLFVLDSCATLCLADKEKTYDTLFSNFDRNHDGVLDWQEIWTGMSPLLEQSKKKNFTWEAKPTMTSGSYELMVKEMFDAADANRDGVL